MSISTRKKRSSIVVVLIGALAMAGAAFAFWTAGGTGTGTASTGSTQALTAVQTSTITGMYPGDSAQTLSGNFTNPNSGPIQVQTVTASIASVAKATGAPSGTCDDSDYTLGSAVMTVGTEVAAGTAKGSWGGATIKFNNKSVEQNACKGAVVTISYAIS